MDLTCYTLLPYHGYVFCHCFLSNLRPGLGAVPLFGRLYLRLEARLRRCFCKAVTRLEALMGKKITYDVGVGMRAFEKRW